MLTLSYYTLNWLLFYLQSFTLGWITPAKQSLQKNLLFVLKSFAVSVRLATIFIYYVIKNTPSDAESRDKQDGIKHKFVGGTMAELWPDLDKGVMKNMEEK